MVSTPLLQSHPLVCIQLPDRQHLQLSVPRVLELKTLPYLKKEWRKKGGKNLQKEGGRKGGMEGKKGEREEGRERRREGRLPAQKTLCSSWISWHSCWKHRPPSGGVVQPLSHVRLFATPWTAAFQASLSFTISQSLLKFMSTELVMLSNHLMHPECKVKTQKSLWSPPFLLFSQSSGVWPPPSRHSAPVSIQPSSLHAWSAALSF